MSALKVQGSPKEFDAMLRPVARLVQLSGGTLGTAIIVFVGWWWSWPAAWWWAPAPLALSFLFYEWIFWARADKPLQLGLTPDEVTIEDPFLDKRRRVALDGIHTATLVTRQTGSDRVDAVLSLCDRESVVLALQFRMTAQEYEARPEDVDADLCDAVLGSISGLLRALAPREMVVRQVVEDAAALAWFREQLPPEVWARSSVRFWRGSAPELDLFGYHATPADGLLLLDGLGVRFSDSTDSPDEQLIVPADPTFAERGAVLFRMFGEEHEEAEERLTLWLQPLADRLIAIPAPLAAEQGPTRELDDDLLHVHAPEGAVILWHLWRTIPPEAWPTAWREALSTARPTLSSWPDAIPAVD